MHRFSWSAIVLGAVLVALSLVLFGVPLANPLLLVVYVVAFHLAERVSVHVDVRSEAVAVSATDFLLVIGFFVLPPGDLLVARLAGGLAHRPRAAMVETRIHVGLMLVTTAVAVQVAYLLGMPDVADPRTWSLVLAAIGLRSLLETTALAGVVRALSRSRARLGPELAVAMFVWGQVLAVVGLSSMLLASIRPLAAAFALVPAVVLLVGYRLLVRERHEATRLRTLSELSTRLSGGTALDQVVADVVADTRELLRCAEIELLVRGGARDGGDLCLVVDPDGRLASNAEARCDDDLLRRWDADGGPGDGLLEDDEITVPVASGDHVVGFLRAVGRPLGREAFGPADQAALRNLADRVGAVAERVQLTRELRNATAATQFLETHDVLTGLGNRRWFVGSLERRLAADDALAVSLLNLRGFRRVNERLGPTAGDHVLAAVGRHLSLSLPEDALVARFSGDEFAVAVEAALVDRLEDVLTRPIRTRVAGEVVEVSVAAGVVVGDGLASSPGDLLRSADLAMVVARRQASGGVVHHDDELELTVARRLRLAADLGTAIESGELGVHFQPLVDARTGDTVAVEALARWDHPTFGPVSPCEFVAAAEETGQIGDLTRHVLGIAADRVATWRLSGHDVEASVNVSALDLDGGELVDAVRSVLDETGLPPHRLVLEVTETAMMADRDRAARTLAALADLGVGLAIDDFGTGHSSLAYLRDLPVTEVKVDRAFVADLTTNRQSELIVRAVVELATGRDLVVVAEGVEDAATMEKLAQLGVDRIQGWHTGRPAPAERLALLDTADRARSSAQR